MSNVLILVAEDHPVNQAVIARQLDALGYPNVVVSNGREALAALEKSHFDLLLADCHMPDVDGFELTRLIRKHEGGHRRLPIVALSASALPEQVRQCMAAGMDGFLAKPVTLRDLGDKIVSFLGDTTPESEPSTERLDDIDDETAHLAGFYQDPEQWQTILSELLVICRKEFSELEAVLRSGDVPRQRRLLHRIEGSLGMVMPAAADTAPLGPDASIEDRVTFVGQRIAHLESLLRNMEQR